MKNQALPEATTQSSILTTAPDQLVSPTVTGAEIEAVIAKLKELFKTKEFNVTP